MFQKYYYINIIMFLQSIIFIFFINIYFNSIIFIPCIYQIFWKDLYSSTLVVALL